jgi:hypothetical protein
VQKNEYDFFKNMCGHVFHEEDSRVLQQARKSTIITTIQFTLLAKEL